MAKVTIFTPYKFQEGEKIFIEAGKRRGDWLVVAVDGDNVTLRCPVSLREFTWKNFCYQIATKEQQWPQPKD